MLHIRVKPLEKIYVGEAQITIQHDAGRFKVHVEAPAHVIVENERVREARLNREAKDREFGGGS